MGILHGILSVKQKFQIRYLSRPVKSDSDLNYVSAYTDSPNDPKLPFGNGLSYTSFSYGGIDLNKKSFKPGDSLTASIIITNSGNFEGKETVHLYLRDLVGFVVRPVRELKGFQQIFLKAGESTKISFTITADMLRFYYDKLEYIFEPGDFRIFIGGNSRDVKEASFSLIR